MLAGEPKETEQKQLLERILASNLFRKSPRLSGFLRFIHDEQAAGREDAINEQLIGTEVFGRRSGYHVGRTALSVLRQGFCGKGLNSISLRKAATKYLFSPFPKVHTFLLL
jgi:hypothetical protein